MHELENGGFRPVIDDAAISDKAAVKRIVLCSGKVYYDLDAARGDSRDVAIVRLEQFYPFPTKTVQEIFAAYPSASEIIWAQEEPQNMGGWAFVESRIRAVLPEGRVLQYVGRTPSASPATGSYAIHNLEQSKLIEEALRQATIDKVAA